MIIEELRIGNLLNEANRMNSKTLLTGETVYIESKIMGLGKYGCRILQGVNYKNILIDVLQPIPLTEEWLEKFGFEKHHTDFSCHSFMLKHTNGNEWIMKFYPFELGSASEIKGGRRIYFVHQLQNLYFALTGEELEIKE